MAFVKISAQLDRSENHTPWGFRMSGGKDFAASLVVQKVNPGSLSEKCGLKEGDIIIEIGGYNTEYLTHQEAQQLILSQGNSLNLKLERDSSYGQPFQHHAPQNPTFNSSISAFNLTPTPFGGFNKPISNPLPPSSFGITPSQGSPDKTNTPSTVLNNINNNSNAVSETSDAGFFPTSITTKSATIFDSVDDKSDTLSEVPSISSPTSLSNSFSSKSSFSKDKTTQPSNDKAAGEKILSRRPSQSKSFLQIQSSLDESQSDVLKKSTATHASNNDSLNKLKSKPSVMKKPQPPVAAKPRAINKSKIKELANNIENNNNYEKKYNSEKSEEIAENSEGDLKMSKGAKLFMKKLQNKSTDESDDKTNTTSTIHSMNNINLNNNIDSLNKNESNSDNNSSKLEVEKSNENVFVKSLHECGVDNRDFVAEPKNSVLYNGINKNHELNKNIFTNSEPTSTNTFQTKQDTSPYPDPPVSPQVPMPSSPNEDEVIKSSNRKQIIVKKISKTSNENNIPKEEILESSERKKIIVKTKSKALQNENLSQQVADNPSNQAPSEDLLLQNTDRKQIEIKPKTQPRTFITKTTQASQDDKPHGPSEPVDSQPVGAWAPPVPSGERKIKVGKAGEAQSRGPVAGGARIPVCATCQISIRGPFIAALDKTWCPDHFICSNPHCKQPLMSAGFVEERGELFCVKDFEKYLAPKCAQCSLPIVGDSYHALGLYTHPKCFVCTKCRKDIPKYQYVFDEGKFYCKKALKSTYHVGCFSCSACGKSIGTGRFHTEGGQIYCEQDWISMFGNVCNGCKFPIEDNERWIEALSQTWHPRCFNCSSCQINLDGKSFCNKGGKPYCKKHGSARGW